MIISEKQIIQLISGCRLLAEELISCDDMMNKIRGEQILWFLNRITKEQSEELKDIK